MMRHAGSSPCNKKGHIMSSEKKNNKERIKEERELYY
jgi:hypothetical protein